MAPFLLQEDAGGWSEAMREKFEFRQGECKASETDQERVLSDLEDRGVDSEFSRPVAERLVAIAPDLSTLEYAAVLDGVSAAYGVHREISGSSDARSRDGKELERLMDGFTGELRKLDEGLQILSAYLVRMSALLSREDSRNFH